MARVYNPPDFDEPPPPSYEESQNTAYNPASVPSPEQSSHQDNNNVHQQHTTIPTGPLPSSSIHPGLLCPSTLSAGGPSCPTLTTAANTLLSSTGLYSNVAQQQQQQRPYSSVPISGCYYHTIHIPRPQGYYQGRPSIRCRVDPSERRFPIAALFFLFGWFCPPFWVLGACCCSGRSNRYEAWWGKINFVMAVMFILSSIVYSMIALTMGDWMVGLRVLRLSTTGPTLHV